MLHEDWLREDPISLLGQLEDAKQLVQVWLGAQEISVTNRSVGIIFYLLDTIGTDKMREFPVNVRKRSP
uniref:Uncharacterized protein n=1 Tax=Paenibacillus athensensis TaxID=1967502 RepID=A0A4Y8Q7F9_9BACL